MSENGTNYSPEQSLENSVGKTINIDPRSLINKKLLFTTQGGVDLTKLRNALEGRPSNDSEPPKGWVFLKDGKTGYVLGDGNHRTALAYLNSEEIPLYINGIWEGKPPIGFNSIIKRIVSELRSSL